MAVVVILGLVATDPIERFEAFKRPPESSERDPSYIRSHLLSTSGNARWEYWTVAVDEFEAHPVAGAWRRRLVRELVGRAAAGLRDLARCALALLRDAR